MIYHNYQPPPSALKFFFDYDEADHDSNSLKFLNYILFLHPGIIQFGDLIPYKRAYVKKIHLPPKISIRKNQW